MRIGLDSGSRTTKAVLIDDQKRFLWGKSIPTGLDPRETARELLDKILSEYPNARDSIIGVTGYGRNLLSGLGRITSEILCQARGVRHLIPTAGSILDIGGQDAKFIVLGDGGEGSEFAMNDKCAAGAGRFLEVVAARLETPVTGLGELAAHSHEIIEIDSTCAVFAESEVIGMIARGAAPADIAAAVHRSVARRQRQLAAGLTLRPPFVFTGGVAHNPGMHSALSDLFGSYFTVPDHPDLTAAIGAALT